MSLIDRLKSLAGLLKPHVQAPDFALLIVGSVVTRPDGTRYIASLGMVSSMQDDAVVRAALTESLRSDGSYINEPLAHVAGGRPT